MSNKLKLLPDYECYALWDIEEVENIDPTKLPISEELKARIASWEDAYDRTLNQDDPTASGFSNHIEESSFEEEGRLIWEALKEELGGDYEISYFSILENELLT